MLIRGGPYRGRTNIVIARVSDVSGGKEKRWKRKRDRENLLSPSPLGRPDTRANIVTVHETFSRDDFKEDRIL